MCVAGRSLPAVLNKLLGLSGVEGQVDVSTVLYLLSVGPLIIIADQAYNSGVICELDYVVQAMNRYQLWVNRGLRTQPYGMLVSSTREDILHLKCLL